jgi:hypothetical protein
MVDVDKKPLATNIAVSIGSASFDEEPDINRFLNLADGRLVEAKKGEKNRIICTWTPPLSQSKVEAGPRGLAMMRNRVVPLKPKIPLFVFSTSDATLDGARFSCHPRPGSRRSGP